MSTTEIQGLNFDNFDTQCPRSLISSHSFVLLKLHLLIDGYSIVSFSLGLVFFGQTFAITGEFDDLFKLSNDFKKTTRFGTVSRWPFRTDIRPLFVSFLLCYYLLCRLVFTRKVFTGDFPSPPLANILIATSVSFLKTIKETCSR